MFSGELIALFLKCTPAKVKKKKGDQKAQHFLFSISNLMVSI